MEETVQKRGVSLRKLNYLMSGVTFAISVLLLITTFLTANRYRSVRNNTNSYISWNQNAELLMAGSDYLTEQVRLFAFKGEREFLDNYFKEAKETKQRDAALEALEELQDSEAFKMLEDAMAESVKLMQTEYYSMRLVVEAKGYNVREFPEEIQTVVLKDGDAALSNEDKMALALRILVDENYDNSKELIRANTQSCLTELADIMESRMEESLGALNTTLLIQQLLIIGLVVVILVVLVLTSVQVIHPLVKAVPQIREEKPLPTGRGAYEYRFLARTYNKMYEANKQSKKQLTYEANHDKLTGLLNRSGFEQIASTIELESSAFLLLDVDDFKKINDNYGHDAGDRALIMLANEIRKNFRTGDAMCRLGGDEFVVILTRISKDHEHFKERISEKFDRINDALSTAGSDLPLYSISAGIAFGEKGDDEDDILKRADIALYEVKRSGKRACRFYS